jgi:hypothetical protein
VTSPFTFTRFGLLQTSRERLTLIRLFEELRSCGYAGGYDADDPAALREKK